MARAVVLIHPTLGHLTPALPVLAELVRRGEEIVCYGTGRSREPIERTGARFRLYGRPYEDFDPTPPTGGLFSDLCRLLALTEELLPGLVEEVKAEAPEYLLLDSKSLWGRLTGQVLGTPAITLSVVFAIRPGVVRLADLVERLSGGAPRERLLADLQSLGRYFEICRRVDRRFGTRSPDVVEFLGNPQPLNLIFTSREFQPQSEAFGDGYRFVGASILPGREPGGSFPFDRLASGPLVYASLGTTFNRSPDFYRACAEAFSGGPGQIVLSTGGVRHDLGAPPANVLVRDFVPQLAMLERTDVFLSHGGMNSVQESLYFGVPLVIVPQRGDQHLVAARVADLGAGLTLHPRDLTPGRLRDAARQVLAEPRFRERARALGRSLREAGGYPRAAAEILAATAAGRLRSER